MRKRIFDITFIAILLFSSSVYAQQNVKIDTDDLTDEQKAQLILKIEEMKKANTSSVVENVASNLGDPKKLNEWVDLGKNVGLALTAVAKELGVASDQILQSDTGKIALVMIVWKVMGRDVLDIVGGVTTWFVIAPIILWSFHFFHMTKRVKDKDGNVQYVSRYEFEKDEAKVGSVWAHGLSFAALTVVCMLIVFA